MAIALTFRSRGSISSSAPAHQRCFCSLVPPVIHLGRQLVHRPVPLRGDRKMSDPAEVPCGTIDLTPDQKFQVLLGRFENHTATLRALTGFDLQIMGGRR